MPRNSTKLTARFLGHMLKNAQLGGNALLQADAKQRGLYAQSRRGKLFFLFIYNPPGGGPRKRLQLGEFPSFDLDQARSLAHDLYAKVKHGKDPQEERREVRRKSATVEDAVRAYLRDLLDRAESGVSKRGKRGGYDTARKLLESYVLPELGSIPLRDLTEDRIRTLHRQVRDSKRKGKGKKKDDSPKAVTANRMLTAFSAVFGTAQREKLCDADFNPAKGIERYTESGVRRALTISELQRLGVALHELVNVHPSAILTTRLLALTGFRRGEVLGHALKPRRNGREGLRWSDIDFETGVVTLHDSKTGRQERVIGRAAIELLQREKPADAQPDHCVCPGITGRTSPLVGYDKIRQLIYKQAGLTGVDAHSLRHSFASIGAQLDSGRYIGAVSALLGHGHQSKSITERYIHSSAAALRPAADAISNEIARLLGIGELAEVVQFPTRA